MKGNKIHIQFHWYYMLGYKNAQGFRTYILVNIHDKWEMRYILYELSHVKMYIVIYIYTYIRNIKIAGSYAVF